MAASELYDFFLTKFCDWYIELSKVTLRTDKKDVTANVLVYVLSQLLKMLHPFIPFITEEIYLNLPIHDKTIVLTSFPEEDNKLNFKEEHKLFEAVRDSIKSVRNIRAEMNVADNVRTNILVLPVTNNEFVAKNLGFIEKLAGGKSIQLLDNDSTIDSSYVSIVNNLTKLFIPIGDMQDIQKEIERLNNELKVAESEIARATGKLANAGFVDKAPAALVEAEKEKIKKYTDLKESILSQITKLSK
ncbi:MAG: class I tRNA ligase family protein, partial [Clostridia bacterium]|nr:class I tRNA ligase family protein [Clostridia bacterium]